VDKEGHMTHGSFFTGIAGFDIAAEEAGFENVFQVENNDFCQKLLNKRFPNAERYKDIYEFNGYKYVGRMDIISGGFPCQTYSVSGKGKMDSRLWKEMFRCIREIKPRWVVAENVLGLVTRKGGVALEMVCADLESEGYTVLPPLILPSCAIDADHRRERVWIVAYSFGLGCKVQEDNTGSSTKENRHKEGTVKKRFKWSSETAPLDSYSNTFLQFESEFCEPPIFGVDDGLSKRLDEDRLKSVGNTIHPGLAYRIFKAIKEIDNLILR